MHKLKVTVLIQNGVQGSQLCLALPDLPAGDDCAWEHTVRHCLVQDQMQMLIHSVLNTVFAEGARQHIVDSITQLCCQVEESHSQIAVFPIGRIAHNDIKFGGFRCLQVTSALAVDEINLCVIQPKLIIQILF